MTAQIETFLWCKANQEWSTTVAGSKGRTYDVSYDYDRRIDWSCTCPAWRYNNKRMCKHITKVMNDKCDHGWEAVCGSPANDWIGDDSYRSCPKCDGPVTSVKVAV